MNGKMHMVRQNSEKTTSSSPVVRILDPDPLSRNAIADVVRTMNLGQEQYSTGHELLEQLNPERPGCVVLELRVPDWNGLEIQRRIAERPMKLPVVFLSAQSTVSIAVQALRAGAVHFLQKPVRDAELWNAIQEAVDRDRRQRLVSMGDERLKQRLARLTAADWRLMERLMAGQPNRVIAAELGVAVRTVEVRRAKLMRKLEAKSYMQFLQIALSAGVSQRREAPMLQAP